MFMCSMRRKTLIAHGREGQIFQVLMGPEVRGLGLSIPGTEMTRSVKFRPAMRASWLLELGALLAEL